MALAPDGLTSVGGYTGDEEKGAQLFQQVDGGKMREDFRAAAAWLKSRPDSTGKLGAVGFFEKPFEADELLATIKQALARKPTELPGPRSAPRGI